MPKTREIKPLEANTCFGCGEENPIGLKLSFKWDGATARTAVILGKQYEGWPGVVHGGIVFTLLDEAMAWVSRFEKMETLTAKAEVKYRKPLRVGEEVVLTASAVKKTRKTLEAKSTLSSSDGTIIAEGSSTMLRMDDPVKYIGLVEGAVIWDLDGVLVDTAEYHFASWRDTLNKRGRRYSREEFRQTFGMRNDEIIRKILGGSVGLEEIQSFAREKEDAFRSLIKGNLKALPGVMFLLKELKEKKYKMALATSAPLENVKAMLKELGIEDYFQTVVADEDVKRGKPDPEVFLKAAEKLGAEPSSCLVLEDSIAGIQAAKSAGMRCIAVATTHPREKLARADMVVSTLEEVCTDTVEELLREKTAVCHLG